MKSTHPFNVDAMVTLTHHLHALWTLPVGDRDYPTRWMLIKASFSRQIPTGERRSDSRQAKGNRFIWQRRHWEHGIKVARFDFFPNQFGSTCRVIKKADWQTMTEHNLFYYPYGSFTSVRLPLLKVTVPGFDKLVILDHIGGHPRPPWASSRIRTWTITYKVGMAFTIFLIGHLRGRPPGLAGGISGASISHSWSERSLG